MFSPLKGTSFSLILLCLHGLAIKVTRIISRCLLNWLCFLLHLHAYPLTTRNSEDNLWWPKRLHSYRALRFYLQYKNSPLCYILHPLSIVFFSAVKMTKSTNRLGLSLHQGITAPVPAMVISREQNIWLVAEKSKFHILQKEVPNSWNLSSNGIRISEMMDIFPLLLFTHAAKAKAVLMRWSICLECHIPSLTDRNSRSLPLSLVHFRAPFMQVSNKLRKTFYDNTAFI